MKLKHKSTLLTCLGAAGMVATVIFAVKETPKAIQILEEEEEIKGEELTIKEKIFAVAPVYWPSAAIGVGTLICIFGSNYLNKKNQAALVSAYSMAQNTLNGYRDEVRERYGEQEEKDIYTMIVKEQIEENHSPAPMFGSACYMFTDGINDGERRLFYDMNSERFFESSLAHVIEASYHLNRNYSLIGGQMLNNYYDFLGIPETEQGNDLGWFMDSGLACIDFEYEKTITDDGLEVTIITTPFAPMPEL